MIQRSRVQALAVPLSDRPRPNNHGQVVRTHVRSRAVTKQYNLVPVEGWPSGDALAVAGKGKTSWCKSRFYLSMIA